MFVGASHKANVLQEHLTIWRVEGVVLTRIHIWERNR